MRRFERITLAVATVVALATLTARTPGLLAQTNSVAASSTTGSAAAVTAAIQDPQSATSGEAASGQASVQVLPMSRRPFYHVFAAFGLAWLLIFGYAVSVRRRLASLEREVERLTR